MGEPLADFSANGVSRSSCLCHNTCVRPGSKHSCACWKDDVKAVISCGQDDLVVEEIGMALTEVMHAYDVDGNDDEGPDLDEDSGDGGNDDSSVDASESSISKSVDGKSSINVSL